MEQLSGLLRHRTRPQPPKSPCLGPDTAGYLIEVLYLRLLDEHVITHAMPLRKHFERCLIGPRR